MNHRISKNGFHGDFEVIFRGQNEGFELSPAQARKWVAAQCPSSENCTCGGKYGTGYEEDSARIEYDATSDSFRLIPSN